MYQPKLPSLALARGCTSLAFMQVAQADVIVLEKLSDMDFVKSSNHMVTGRKCFYLFLSIGVAVLHLSSFPFWQKLLKIELTCFSFGRSMASGACSCLAQNNGFKSGFA
jgi:hypothetical protein